MTDEYAKLKGLCIAHWWRHIKVIDQDMKIYRNEKVPNPIRVNFHIYAHPTVPVLQIDE